MSGVFCLKKPKCLGKCVELAEKCLGKCEGFLLKCLEKCVYLPFDN